MTPHPEPFNDDQIAPIPSKLAGRTPLGPGMTRRSALVATGLAILAVGTAGAGFAQSAVAAGPKSGDDALVLRTISEVEHFSAWLGGKPGLVGEFGVPAYNNATGDVDKFTHLLSRFFDRADELALNTQGWVAANWSGGTASHSMGVYNNAANDGRINNASVAARVLESRYAYGAAHGLLRGVNLSGIDHPEARRTDGPAVFVPTAADVAYLASRGVKSIRLPSMWEHLQPNLGGPLDTTRLAVLQQIITACASNGIRVILDLAHNYGRYELPSGGGLQTIALSSGPLTAAHLADFWSKVATWVKADPTRASTVHSFDIMNEPHDLAAEAGTGGSVIYDFESGTTQGFEANHAWISLANST
ncbi:MAG: endoglucanase, partial [Microbacteriaceae bacterium]|nr:endoglucanase [Microbacteriaceae bacterium]